MKRGPAVFLQTAIIFVGIAVFAFLLWEPTIEGRNAHATLFEIYFEDTFLACAYIASIPFFASLYLAFKLLGRAGRNEVVSSQSLRDLRAIKYCMIVIIGFVAAGEATLFMVVRGEDDIAGGVAMGILVASLTGAIAVAAAVFERVLQNRMSLERQ
jgi:hypothetical protein